MRLIKTIPLDQVRVSIDDLTMDYPQFTFVLSQDSLKIYQQVR